MRRTPSARSAPSAALPALPLPALLLLLALPGAQAHAAPDPLDNETHLLADGGDDSYAYAGGLDLQDLFAREAWHRPRAAEGVIFRMIVYGSAGPADTASPLRLTLGWTSPAGTGQLSLSSPDGITYTAEGADLVEASMESEGSAIQGSIQVFVPYAALGAGRGEAIEGWAWQSWVAEDLRDVAPGGRPVPGTQGAVMVPEESTVVTPSLALEGPRGYTRSTAGLDAGTARVEVQNLITATGQHVLVELPAEAPGWRLGEPEPAGSAVDAGQHPSFSFTAMPGPAAAPLTVFVTTDLGGREAVTLQPDGGAGGGDGGGGAAPEAPDGPGAPSGGKDTPGPGLLPAALAVAAAAWASRRR